MNSSDFSTPLTMNAGCVPVRPRSGYTSSILHFGMRRMYDGCPPSSYSTVTRPPVAASTLARRVSFVIMVAISYSSVWGSWTVHKISRTAAISSSSSGTRTVCGVGRELMHIGSKPSGTSTSARVTGSGIFS